MQEPPAFYMISVCSTQGYWCYFFQRQALESVAGWCGCQSSATWALLVRSEKQGWCWRHFQGKHQQQSLQFWDRQLYLKMLQSQRERLWLRELFPRVCFLTLWVIFRDCMCSSEVSILAGWCLSLRRGDNVGLLQMKLVLNSLCIIC